MARSAPTVQTATEAVDDWPRYSRKTAETLLEKYGRPDEVTSDRLVWHDNGPWKRTILHRSGPWHAYPIPHRDYLEQYVDYEVPPEAFDDLAEYDGSVHADRTRGEIGASCHQESANLLALNLAHDVVTGERAVDEARDAYARIMVAGKAGGSPEYMQGLQFGVQSARSRDRDVTYLTEVLGGTARTLGLAAVLGAVVYYALRRRRSAESVDHAVPESATDRPPRADPPRR